MKKVIGIDLGTTNSVVAFKAKNVETLRNKETEELTRSCVALQNDELVVGKYAFDELGRNPEDVILSIKRLMGRTIDDPMVQKMIKITKDPFGYYKFELIKLASGDGAVAVVLKGRQYTPEQISAEILKKLKSDAEEKLNDQITHAVITVPAYFIEKQKNATRVAANIAGLKVSRLLAEPTAAAISYGVDTLKPGEAKTVLVYDFGGGTCDLSILSIVDGQYLEIASGGDRWLGGDDLDQALQEYIFNKIQKEYNLPNIKELILKLPNKKKYQFFAEMREKTEQIKIQLSSTTKANLNIISLLEDENGDDIDIDVNVTRTEFEEIIQPYVQRSIDLIDELLKKVSYDIEMIDHILLVGGVSCIPLVKRMLREKYGESKIMVSNKPMLAIAEGAAILALRSQDEYECPNCSKMVQQNAPICQHCGFDLESEMRQNLKEVVFTTKHEYFIEVLDRTGKLYPDPIIGAQTPLPVSIQTKYKTTVNNQQIINFRLLSDIEHGEIQSNPMTIGFATLGESMSAESDIIIEIQLDKDEIFRCYFYPLGQQHKKKEIILGRDDATQKILKNINDRLNVADSENFALEKKQEYYKVARKFINELENLNPIDIIDREISIPRLEKDANKAFDNLPEIEIDDKTQHDEKKMIMTYASIMCREYPALLGIANAAEMEKLIAVVQNEEDSFAINQALERLEELIEKNQFILAIFMLKIAANEAMKSNPTDANQLFKMHDSIVSHFQKGNRVEGFNELNKAMYLAQKYLSKEQAIELGRYLRGTK